MSFESTLNWIAFGILGLAFAYRAVIVQTLRIQDKMAFQFWQKVGLPFGTEEVRVLLRRRLRRSANAGLLGGLAGALAAGAIQLFTHTPWLSFTFMWSVAIPAVIIGVTAFDVALTLRDSLFGQRPDAPRMARLEAVALGDYMSPLRLRTAPFLMVLAACLGAAGVVLGVTGAIDVGVFLLSPAVPLFVAAAVVLGLCAVMAHKILEQPQPAADTLELAWDDSIRADVLRKLGLLASVMAWLSVTAVSMGVLDGLGTTPAVNMGVALGQLLSVWGYVAFMSLYSYGSSFNYFRFRLWPNFNLQPGSAAPAHSSTSSSKAQDQP